MDRNVCLSLSVFIPSQCHTYTWDALWSYFPLRYLLSFMSPLTEAFLLNKPLPVSCLVFCLCCGPLQWTRVACLSMRGYLFTWVRTIYQGLCHWRLWYLPAPLPLPLLLSLSAINYHYSSLGEIEPDKSSLILDEMWAVPVLCRLALLWVHVCHSLAIELRFLTDSASVWSPVKCLWELRGNQTKSLLLSRGVIYETYIINNPGPLSSTQESKAQVSQTPEDTSKK